MFSAATTIREIHASLSGTSTIVLELWGEDGGAWTVTTGSSPEDYDYGCLYFNDDTPMSRPEELVLLRVLDAYLAAGGADDCEYLRFVADLLRAKGQ
jgi:hypothetical protein